MLGDTVTLAQVEQVYATACELARCGDDVIVACDGARSLNVSAIQVLLALEAELAAHGARLALSGVSEVLGATLRLAGVERYLPWTPGAATESAPA